jgi:hypothetical protein
MDVLELLTSDHNTVRKLFGEFEEAQEAGDSGRMAELAQQIFHELEVHTTIEEEVFYPEPRRRDPRCPSSSRKASKSTTSSAC